MHHYSLLVLIVVRVAFTVAQIQLVLRNVAPFDEKFDFYSWQTSLILRIMIPGSMLFMTDFRQYVIVIFPLTVIAQSYLTSQVPQIYANQNVACEKILENFKMGSIIYKDFFWVILYSLGMYSHKKSLVTRFILYKKDIRYQLQQT